MSYWNHKITVVTGGSEGLGFAIANKFASEGATPILIARNLDNLKLAQQRIADQGFAADFVVCDVTDPKACEEMLAEIVARHGKIDVLVNNVGKSTRADLMMTPPEKYSDLINVNLMTAINCSLPALPYLEKSNGHLVNIGSLSSKFAWPWMAPYTTSKFALAGFTQQLRLEGPSNIHVLLVCPGPIRRPDSEERYAKESEGLPDHVKTPGAGVSLKGLDPERLAEKILKACRKKNSS